MKADLHVHSNYSDGSDEILELAEKLQNSGVEIFALTDHDTVEGCEKMRHVISDRVKFIPGIELTCCTETIKCHILGYNCDIKNETLLKLIEKGKILRRKKLETRINHLSRVWGINLTKEELNWLYSRNSVVKTHIGNILVNRKLAPDNVSAMKKYLDGCITENSRFSAEEGIAAINAAGGIPVWAHPLGGEGESHFTREEFLPKLKVMKSLNIKGLECYYSRYNFEEINFLVDCATKNNLLITGGSDYHGKNKNIPLLKLNCDNSPIDSDELTLLKFIK